MAWGLRIWDADGNLTLDTSSNIVCLLGQIDLGEEASGSRTVADFSRGTPWFLILPSGTSYAFNFTPSVTISGTTITWSSSGSTAIILYGVH
jgi:hypothetical protein